MKPGSSPVTLVLINMAGYGRWNVMVIVINMHLAQKDHNIDVSLADISVMAQADGESGKPNECYNRPDYTCYEYENKYACFHMCEPVNPPYNCEDD